MQIADIRFIGALIYNYKHCWKKYAGFYEFFADMLNRNVLIVQ